MAFFQPKGLRAEVVGGVDIETGVTLAGERVSLGSGPDDTLVLGDPEVAPGQLVFQRAEGGRAWDYFVSDRGVTEVAGGKGRTGRLRPGMSFRLGSGTRVAIRATKDAPAPAPTGEGAQAAKVPMGIALPLLALMVLAAVAVAGLMRGEDAGPGGLATGRWFGGGEPLAPALLACLEQGAPEGAGPVAPGDPDAALRAWFAAAEGAPGRTEALDAMQRVLGEIIARSHFLAGESRPREASAELRRIENVLPLRGGGCPILSAARTDVALLELRGRR